MTHRSGAARFDFDKYACRRTARYGYVPMTHTILTALAWIFAAFAMVPLAMTLMNLLVWPRGRRWPADKPMRDAPSVSILIPARDEAATIERAVRGATSGRLAAYEVIVCDDGSTDGTSEILDRLAKQIPELRVIQGRELPDGWVGKPFACSQLAEAASGDVLLFVDADTVLEKQGIERLLSLFDDFEADVVSVVPAQEAVSFAERLMMPLLHLTYTSWLPLPLIWRTHDDRFLAANGQVLGFRKQAYEIIGGFEAVRSEIVDDMAICRLAKQANKKVVFADGFCIARCRMYGSWSEVRDGFSKNMYEGVGGTSISLAFVIALHVFAFLGSWLMIPAALLGSVMWLPVMLGVGANLVTRTALALRHQHSFVSVFLHPVAIAGMLAIAINSWRWSRNDALIWAGRIYSSRGHRSTRND